MCLFNIHLRPGIDGQPARDRLPDNFEPEPRGEVLPSEMRGMHLFVSETVNAPEMSAQVPAGCVGGSSGCASRFSHFYLRPFFGGFAQLSGSREQGAILATPDPLISSRDSLSDRRLEEYFKKHVWDWIRFLEDKVPDRVEPEGLLLVTGVDRTTSWANAVFSNTSLQAGFGLEVQFIPGTEIACRYNWRNVAKAVTKYGPNCTTSSFEGASAMFPAQDIGHLGAQQHSVNSVLDQTIFIRHIRCKRRWKYMRRRPKASRALKVDSDSDVAMADDVAQSDDTGGHTTHPEPETAGDSDEVDELADVDVDTPYDLDVEAFPSHEDVSVVRDMY